VALALVAAAGPPSSAQQKPLRIGVLGLGPRKVPAWQCGPQGPHKATAEPQPQSTPIDAAGLRDELEEKFGYVEDLPKNSGKPGRRFVLEIRQGTVAELDRFAEDLVQQRVDLIFAFPTLPVKAAQKATRANPIPIIFAAVSDPVGDGFVKSVDRPEGFITGISTQLVQGSEKRVELFKEMLPGARRLLTIYKADFPVAQRSLVEMRKAAAALGITLIERHANHRAEVQAALAGVQRGSVDGVIIAVDAVVTSNIDAVLDASLPQRLPVFGILDFMADWGALAAYGPSPYQAGRQAAHYVDKIVKGQKPGSLPVVPLDPTFVVNLKTAACLGVTVPPAVLPLVERVIR
jgi:putative ABC transport system substrate-binding protein